MKILFVSDYLEKGGAEEVLKNNIDLFKNDYEISLFIGERIKFRFFNPFAYIFSLRSFLYLIYRLFRFQPQVVHVYNYHHLLSPSILFSLKVYLLFRQANVIFSAHDCHLICPSSGYYYYNKSNAIQNFVVVPTFGSIVFKRIDKRILHDFLKKTQWFFAYKIFRFQRVFDQITCPSNHLVSLIAEYNSRLASKCIVLRNPISLAVESKKTPDTSKITSAVIRMVFIGRISPEKGILEFINLLAKVEKIEYIFDIYGTGPLLETAKILVVELGLQDRVVLKGFVENRQLLTVLNVNYNLLVLPSLINENAPLSIIEGYSRGLKVLTHDFGGMKEMANFGTPRYLFKPLSVISLEAALNLFISEKETNLVSDLTEFSNDIFCNTLSKIYQDGFIDA